jgi:hypothetical protein
MLLSKDAKLVSGITLLLIPTIMYGGWTLLGILTHGEAAPGNFKLNDTQWALWRAGHAHAGVWTMLSLRIGHHRGRPVAKPFRFRDYFRKLRHGDARTGSSSAASLLFQGNSCAMRPPRIYILHEQMHHQVLSELLNVEALQQKAHFVLAAVITKVKIR